VIAVVEGDQVIIESPNGEFQPFTANYGEVVIIPASMDHFITRPSHPSTTRHGILKAYVKES
jgi:oxalate decarboxylase/phosphoglucose isomerase-like protein (cupin superfamily)